jgi:hypothetical protein
MPSLKTDNPPQQETFSQTPSGKIPSQGGDLRNAYGMTSVIANYSGFDDWQSLIDGIKVGGSAKKGRLSLFKWSYVKYFHRVKRYLGPVQLHFIKDAWTMRSEGKYL